MISKPHTYLRLWPKSVNTVFNFAFYPAGELMLGVHWHENLVTTLLHTKGAGLGQMWAQSYLIAGFWGILEQEHACWHPFH